MRSALLILAAMAACDSCGTYAGGKFGGPPVAPSDARESVYKIMLTEKVLVPQELQDALEVGPTVDSTHWGTAWVAGYSEKGDAYLITAGHLCNTSGLVDTPFGKFNVESTKYQIQDLHGNVYDVEVVSDSDTQDQDLCLMKGKGYLGDALPLATEDPPYGAHVQYMGYPKGHNGPGIVPIFEGLFSGRGKPFDDEGERLVFTAFGAPGASGSPVFYRDQVIGVFVEGYPDFWSENSADPYNQIRSFVEKVKKLD